MKHIKVENNFESLKPNLLEKVLNRLLPKANQKFIKVDSIIYWYLEIDKLEIVREIAFDIENKVIYAAPNNLNYGIWCDSPVNLKIFEKIEDISKKTFDFFWEN